MDFGLSDEQVLLRDSARAFVQPSARRAWQRAGTTRATQSSVPNSFATSHIQRNVIARNTRRATICASCRFDAILGVMPSSKLRWGDNAPSEPGCARDRLLDAAEACFGRSGIAKTTIEDVAKEASVSRATVYRHFSGRDKVVSGVIVRATERHLEKIRSRVDAQPDLGSAVLEFVQVTLRAARQDETVGLLFTSDEGLDSGGIIDGASVTLFELVEKFLTPVFEARSDEMAPHISASDASRSAS